MSKEIGGLNDRKMTLSEYIQELEQILSIYRGGVCPLRLTYQKHGVRAVLALGDDWRVQPTDELIRRLERFTLAGQVEVKYNRASQPVPPMQVAS